MGEQADPSNRFARPPRPSAEGPALSSAKDAPQDSALPAVKGHSVETTEACPSVHVAETVWSSDIGNEMPGPSWFHSPIEPTDGILSPRSRANTGDSHLSYAG